MTPPPKPQADPITVETIVGLTASKCFDWGQGRVAETMAAVAAQLARDAVVLKHELLVDELGA